MHLFLLHVLVCFNFSEKSFWSQYMYLKMSPNNGFRWCPLGKLSHLGLEQLCSLLPCGPIIWPIFDDPVVASFATSLCLWHTFLRFLWVLSVHNWLGLSLSTRCLRLGWIRGIVVPPRFLLALIRLVVFFSSDCWGGVLRLQAIDSSVCRRGVGDLQECQSRAWY